jgi:hypothetical protein
LENKSGKNEFHSRLFFPELQNQKRRNETQGRVRRLIGRRIDVVAFYEETFQRRFDRFTTFLSARRFLAGVFVATPTELLFFTCDMRGFL